MLGVQEHQTLLKGSKDLPIAFITEDLQVAAAVQGAFTGSEPKTGVVIINSPPRKGEKFASMPTLKRANEMQQLFFS